MKELLLLLCRYPYDEKDNERLSSLIRAVTDWDKMADLINKHGIIALAAYNIKESGLEKEIPDDVMAILENGYMQSVVRNTWLTERWKEVNAILCDAAIKHVLLKGMALEHTLYDSKGLRQMNDNDILVSHHDSMKAWQLLKQNGFLPAPLKSPLFNKILFEFGRHLPALCKDGYVIEIHKGLFETDSEELKTSIDYIAESREIFIGTAKALILPVEIHLKYLINHFEHHALSGDCQLRLFNDLLMLDPLINIDFPDQFLVDPIQSKKTTFLKASYKANIKSIKPKHRLRFIIGDTFPGLRWMMNRYKCNSLKAVFYYPARIGKLAWLI